MFDLVLSIFFASLIFVIFKLFETFKIQTVPAIVVNYLTASSVGLLFSTSPITITEVSQSKWFYGTIFLGILFFVVFNLIARTSQSLGVSVASVATKMSFVLPVVFGILVYSETLNIFNCLGIILAMAAVYLSSLKGKKHRFTFKSLLLPFLVFLGSGIIDTSLKYVQERHLEISEYPLFSSTVFASAAFSGIIFISIKVITNQWRIRHNIKNIIGGIALGIPNYFSIYFLLRALQNSSLNSASIFTINNVAIVLFSTMLGIILFKEKLNPKNWLGIAFAIISILLISIL